MRPVSASVLLTGWSGTTTWQEKAMLFDDACQAADDLGHRNDKVQGQGDQQPGAAGVAHRHVRVIVAVGAVVMVVFVRCC